MPRGAIRSRVNAVRSSAMGAGISVIMMDEPLATCMKPGKRSAATKPAGGSRVTRVPATACGCASAAPGAAAAISSASMPARRQLDRVVLIGFFR